MKIEKIDINKIRPYEKNAKLHPRTQIDQIKQSIIEFGNNDPIAIDEDGVIIEGHGRYVALQELGYKQAEVIRLEHMTDEQKRAYTLVHNKLTLNSNFDIGLLEEELKEIQDIDMEDFGFDLDEEYEEFVNKFDTQKTTDDCYTPENIFKAVQDYVCDKYDIDPAKCVRPFYPGGDYENYHYPEDCVVLDNPPFSIMAGICRFYQEKGIKFFLFCPNLTNFNIKNVNHIIVGVSITYANGAKVNTSFLTNLGDAFIETDATLTEIVKTKNKENLKSKSHMHTSKYVYPSELLTASKLAKLGLGGVDLKIKKSEVYSIKSLDAQKDVDKAIFGSGFLISHKKAEEIEKKLQETKDKDVYVFELSDREKEIVDELGE